MGKLSSDLIGTLLNTLRINRATIDASGLSAARSFTLPDVEGQIALRDISETAPGAPAADTVRLARTAKGRPGLGVVTPNGRTTPLGPPLWWGNQIFWTPNVNAATNIAPIGAAALTITGTATARNIQTGSYFSRQRRIGYVSAATAGSLCGQHMTQAVVTIGNGAGSGGFRWRCRLGASDGTSLASANAFYGLTSSVAAPTNVNPGTLTNAIGFGAPTAGNLRVYGGGSSAGSFDIDLGSDFPAAGAGSTNVYDFELLSDPFTNTVTYFVENLSSGITATGVIPNSIPGLTLPPPTTLLAHRAWRSNNTTALAAGLDVMNFLLEWD